MTKKEMELELKFLKCKINLLEQNQNKKVLTIDEAQMRDYIVRTNYIGIIEDTNIKKDFKSKIEQETELSFKEACDNILDYKFHNNSNFILGEFYWQLKMFEEKQQILTKYGKTKA